MSLVDNIERLNAAKVSEPDAWGIFFSDGTVAPRIYYEYWLLVQYCLDIKKMTYRELIASSVPMEVFEAEMQQYYQESLSKKKGEE